MIRFSFLHLSVCLVLVASSIAEAQIGIGVRYGEAEGSANYNVGEISGRFPISGRFSAVGLFQIIGGHWACADGPSDTLRCGYDGHSFSLGAAYAAYASPRAYLGLIATLGQFKRTGTSYAREYSGRQYYTGSIGVDAEVGVWGPVRLIAAITHRRISDRVYVSTFGEQPHLTSLTAGVGIALWP